MADVLGLRELVEATAGLEDERVAADKLLDAALVRHMEDLEAGRVDRDEPRSAAATASGPGGRSEGSGATREAVEEVVKLAV